LILIDGVDREQLPAMPKTWYARIDDQATERVTGLRKGGAAGNTLAPTAPGKAGRGNPLSRIVALRRNMGEIPLTIHILRMPEGCLNEQRIERQWLRRGHRRKINADRRSVRRWVGTSVVQLFEENLFGDAGIKPRKKLPRFELFKLKANAVRNQRCGASPHRQSSPSWNVRVAMRSAVSASRSLWPMPNPLWHGEILQKPNQRQIEWRWWIA